MEGRPRMKGRYTEDGNGADWTECSSMEMTDEDLSKEQ
jgi:hypothetical protein